MVGITDLDVLLKHMKPKLVSGEFVFCTVPEVFLSKLKILPLLVFREAEGTTIVVKRKTADDNLLSYSGVWVLISLTVNSGLSAVGFLAAITNKLAESGVSVNAVSAFYHDHLFVPVEKAEKAMQALAELSESKRA